MTALHLGTSSWQFDEWRGVFFPEGLPRQRYLAYYTRHFNSVEVNTSFYGLPRPGTLISWLESAPPGFTFCLKFPRAITHEKRLIGCEQETLAFLDVVRSLGEAAAPALLQFPPDFTRRQQGRDLAQFLEWLPARLEGLRVGVEVRSPDLMTAAFANFLAARDLVLVIAEREGAPDLFPIWSEVYAQRQQPNFVLIRWIGDDKNGPTGNNALVAPRDGQLDVWAERIAGLMRQGVQVFGYMHNPYEGHSPASLRRLQERLTTHIDLPVWAPPSPEAETGAQLSLFA